MGSSDFSVAGLRALLAKEDFAISAIVTKPDTHSGRKMLLNKSPLKIFVEEYNKKNDQAIKIFQPKKINDIFADLQAIRPDLIVVIAYGKILPPNILEIPTYACLNVHASLLPKYRGSACIPAPILNGDTHSGFTLMKMDEGLDSGAIIKKVEIELDPQENALTLMNKISSQSEKQLASIILDYLEGKLSTQKQDENQATYVKKIKKEDGHLDFVNDKAIIIERKVRAFYPWPGTYAFIKNNNNPETKLLFKIQEVANNFLPAPDKVSGEIFVQDGSLWVKAKDLAIKILKVQLEGKKVLESNVFLQGNAWVIGQKLE